MYVYLFHVDFKGTCRLALRTRPGLHFLVLTLVERSQYEATFEAVILDHVELRQDPSAAGHHSTSTNELVEMKLPAS